MKKDRQILTMCLFIFVVGLFISSTINNLKASTRFETKTHAIKCKNKQFNTKIYIEYMSVQKRINKQYLLKLK